MSANASAKFLGLLMATCLASGVSALEVGQTPAPAGNTPSFGLPAFLDGARLPDLQEAWRAHESEPQRTPAAEPAVTPAPTPTSETVSHEEPATSPDPASDAAIESARAAITRAEQATDKAANVRTRAEDLSRRFGAGDAPASPAAAEPTSAVGDGITTGATPAPGDGITTGATPAPGDGAETAAPAEAPVDQPATAVETTATAAEPASADAASDEKSNASPRRLMRAGLTPAAVLPSTAAAERKPATPPARSAGTEPAAEPKPPSGSDPMPLEMRAFGWNSQP